MAFSYIEEADLYTTFHDATKFALPLHQPFEEFERIARNRPHPGIDKSMPKVTDGTLAALIQEQPKRIIQQIPTGLIKTEDEWLELVAGFILQDQIIPNSDQIADLIQKCWAATTKALTYGSQPAFVQFINRGDYFGTDFTLPYVKDVLLEPGKLSDRDSNVMFLRTWWSKNQIQAVMNKEKMLKGKASDRGEVYKENWNLDALSNLLETGPSQKDALQMTPNERGKQLNAGFFEIVHVFQRGEGANFYSFSPKTKETLRTKANKDPRGIIPIHFLYANMDMSNPLGRGSVEMSGGMQNLLDSEVQSYQYMRSLLMNPPLKVRGNIAATSLKYAPGAIWKMGSDPGNDIEPASLETKSLEGFSNNYSLIKSQILNLNSSADTSVSSTAGNPGFSKTPQGVNATEQRLGVSDNYLRKQFESWFGDITETEINLWFAERSGVQVLKLDDDTAMALNKIQPGAVNDKNEIQVDYDTETPKLKFEVDASSSNIKDNADQLDKMTSLLELTGKFPQLDKAQGGPIDTVELADRIVAMSGIEDPEKIVAKPDQPQQQQPVSPQMVQQIAQQTVAQAMQQEKQNDPGEHPFVKMMDILNIKFETLSADVQAALIKEIFGIDQTQPTPSAVDTQVKLGNHALDLAKAGQQQINDQHGQTMDLVNAGNTHHLNTAKQAADLAKAHMQAEQQQAQMVMQQQQQAQQAQQAGQQHALAVAQAATTQGNTQQQMEQAAQQQAQANTQPAGVGNGQ